MPKTPKFTTAQKLAMQKAEVLLADARREIEGDGMSDSRSDVQAVWRQIVEARAALRALLNPR